MKCESCLADKDEKDFLGKEICYRCQYRIKIEGELRFCRECKRELNSNKWVYCSRDCAKVGEKKMKRKYWTNLI